MSTEGVSYQALRDSGRSARVPAGNNSDNQAGCNPANRRRRRDRAHGGARARNAATLAGVQEQETAPPAPEVGSTRRFSRPCFRACPAGGRGRWAGHAGRCG